MTTTIEKEARRARFDLCVIWTFVALTFAAFGFVLHVIWAKSQGKWRF